MPYEMYVSPNGKYAYALVGDFFEGIWHFVRINLDSKSLKSWELPEFNSAKNFTIQLNSDDSFNLRAEDIHLNELNDGMAITVGSSSLIYVYNPQADSLQFINFPHKLTAVEKSGTYPSEVNSKKEYDDIIADIDAQITYGKIVWDSSTKQYFRLGSKKLSTDSKKSEVFLYAFDKELSLIGEQKIDAFEKTPLHYFFKDGKLYSYVNVEDELGFAVFTFDF